MYGEEIISRENHRLEKDIYYLINYIRTNPLDFYNNLKWKNTYNKLNEDQIELINFLENQHDKGTLPPFQEIPEISEAARNLLNNLAINDKKYHDTNLGRLNPSVLNLRTRLSNYGDKTGKVFETVVFKYNNSEEIVNHILFDDKGRKMLLSNKMKYIGVACSILPSNITCSVIDIVQDFYPFRKEREDSNSSRDNTDGKYINLEKLQSQNSENDKQRNSYVYLDDLNYQNNNDEQNIERDKKQINEKKSNIDLSLNNNQNNFSSYELDDNYNIKPYNQKTHQRLKNAYYSNEWNKNLNKLSSMEFPEEKNNLFSSNSVNSYNIIGNDKILSLKKNSIIKKNLNKEKENEDEDEDDDGNNKNIFTMAGRTHKQQEKIIEISTQKNLNKSRSVHDLNIYNKKLNKNKLDQKEKIEILHSINQRNKNPKSLSFNNKILENIINNTSYTFKRNNNNYYIKKSNYTVRNNYPKKNRKNFFYAEKNNYFNSEKDNNSLDSYEFNSSNNRSNEFPKKKNGINNLKYYSGENKGNELKENYSKNKHINEIKSDLILFKNNLKKELKDEVKHELKEEIKNEYHKKPNSNNIDSYLDSNLKSYNNNYRYGLENKEVYSKITNISKNKMKNRCSSEENICGFKKKPSSNIMSMKSNIDYNYIFERKSFDSMTSSGKNDEEGIINNNFYQRNESNVQNYFNKSSKVQDRKEIKKLIKLYNLAKDTQRNKNNTGTIYDNSFNDKLNYFSGGSSINKISDNKKDENDGECYKIKYNKKNITDFESFNKQKEEDPIFSSSSEILSRKSNEDKNKNISNEQENKNKYKYNMINKKLKIPASQNQNNLEKNGNDNKSIQYSSNSTLKTMSYYKPKKVIPYKYFPFKYKSIDFKKENNDNNDNN